MRALVDIVIVAGGILGIFKFAWANRPAVRRRKNIERLRQENDQLDKIINRKDGTP